MINNPVTVTQNPGSGGSSVIGLAFEDGVIIAADNLASFGSMARFRNCQRVHQINKNTILGAGGDYADFQHVMKSIEQKQLEEESTMDDTKLGPAALHTWLTRLQYNKRCKFEPYWVEWVVGGLQNDKPFLGYVDKLGTSYEDKAIASGRLGSLALPLLRKYTEDFSIKLNEQQAREIILKSLEILFYRDCYTTSTFHLAIVSKGKDAKIEGPFELKTNWEQATLLRGYE